MSGERYFVYTLPLPSTVHGCVRPNDDGTFSVYLNSRDTQEEQRDTLRHELRHIEKGHFWSERPLRELEQEAEGLGALIPEEQETVVYSSLEDLRDNWR